MLWDKEKRQVSTEFCVNMNRRLHSVKDLDYTWFTCIKLDNLKVIHSFKAVVGDFQHIKCLIILDTEITELTGSSKAPAQYFEQ